MSLFELTATAVWPLRVDASPRTKCAGCGFRGQPAMMRRPKRRGRSKDGKTFCPACVPYQPSRDDLRNAAAMTFWLVAAAALAAVRLLPDMAEFGLPLLALAGFFLGQAPGLLIHEGAHGLAAKAVGFRVTAIELGAGPALWTGRLKGCAVSVRCYPSGGMVRFHELGRPNRGKRALVFAAGPFANLACCVAGFALLDGHAAAWPAGVAAFSGGMVLRQGLMGVGSLWPHTTRLGGGAYPSDGARLVALLGGSWDRRATELMNALLELNWLRRMGRFDCLHRAALRASARFPESRSLLASVLDSAGLTGGPQAVLDYWNAQRERLGPWGDEPSDVVARAFVEANVAWAALNSGQAGHLELAHAYSASALELQPNQAAMRGLRGAVLLKAGDVQGAVGLLARALRHSDSLLDKAGFCQLLAQGERARGAHELAQEYENLEAWLHRRLRQGHAAA